MSRAVPLLSLYACDAWTGETSNVLPLQYKTFVLATGTVHCEARTHFAMYDNPASEQAKISVSPRRPGFDPRPVNVGLVIDLVDAEFVVDKEQVLPHDHKVRHLRCVYNKLDWSLCTRLRQLYGGIYICIIYYIKNNYMYTTHTSRV